MGQQQPGGVDRAVRAGGVLAALVLTLMLLARKTMHLEDYLTPRHIDAMTRLVLAASCLVGLAYAIEFFTALYGGNRYESFTFLNRAFRAAGLGVRHHGRVQRRDPAVVLVPAECDRQFLAVFVIAILISIP